MVRTDLEFAKSCKYHVTIRQMADIIKWENYFISLITRGLAHTEAEV